MLAAPDYTGRLITHEGYKIFVAYQGPDTETHPTITNNIEYIASKHSCRYVVYLDSEDQWNGWIRYTKPGTGYQSRYIPLGQKGTSINRVLNNFIFKLGLRGV